MRKHKGALRLAGGQTGSMSESDFTLSEPLAEGVIGQTMSLLMGKLPAKEKAAVVLRYLQDLDYAEIAEILHCTQESAPANVYLAIRRLRSGLGESK
jgi:RNA polymerase sigma factor (sigma-70 family)